MRTPQDEWEKEFDELHIHCQDLRCQFCTRRGVVKDFIRTALQEARTQGAQEALAKVEEWAKENTDNYHGELFACIPAHDLLHHLQQLKDNKEV